MGRLNYDLEEHLILREQSDERIFKHGIIYSVLDILKLTAFIVIYTLNSSFLITNLKWYFKFSKTLYNFFKNIENLLFCKIFQSHLRVLKKIAQYSKFLLEFLYVYEKF